MQYAAKHANHGPKRPVLCLAALLAAALLGGCGLSDLGAEPTMEDDPIVIPSQSPVEAALAANEVPYRKVPCYLVEGREELCISDTAANGTEMVPGSVDMGYQQAANRADDLRRAAGFPDAEGAMWKLTYQAPLPDGSLSGWPSERGQYHCRYAASEAEDARNYFDIVFDSINGTVAEAHFDWSHGGAVPENNPYYLIMQTGTEAAQNLQKSQGVTVQTTLSEEEYARQAKESNDWAQSGAPLTVAQQAAEALGLPTDGWEKTNWRLYPETFQELKEEERGGYLAMGFAVWYSRTMGDGCLWVRMDSRTRLVRDVAFSEETAEGRASRLTRQAELAALEGRTPQNSAGSVGEN